MLVSHEQFDYLELRKLAHGGPYISSQLVSCPFVAGDIASHLALKSIRGIRKVSDAISSAVYRPMS